MSYEPQYTRAYENGYVDLPDKSTPEYAVQMNLRDDVIIAIEEYLSAKLPLEVGYSLGGIKYDDDSILISLKNKSGTVISSVTVNLGLSTSIYNLYLSGNELIGVQKDYTQVKVDLSPILEDLVSQARTIAGIDLVDDITAEELQEALGIDDIKEDVSELQNAQDITSTTDATLKGSHAGIFKIDEIGGVTEQFTTTGAQLFDANALYKNNNASFSVSEDEYTITLVGGTYGGWCDSYIELADISQYLGKTLYISLDSLSETATDGAGARGQMRVYEADGTTYTNYNINNDTKKKSAVIPEDASRIAVRIYTNSSGTALETNNTVVVNGLLLSTDENAKWEPYTGRQPSPNPSYPQEIKGVKGKNHLDCRGLESKTLYGVTFTPVNDNNGNLLYVEADGTNDGTYNSDYYYIPQSDMPTLPKGEYILNGSEGGTDTTYGILLGTMIDGSASRIAGSFNGNASFKLTEDTAYYSCIRVCKGQTVNGLRFYPMIRHASVVDDTYVPYGLLRVKAIGEQLFDVNAVSLPKYRINIDTGELSPTNSDQYASGYIEVSADTDYTLNFSYVSSDVYGMAFYDSNKKYISGMKQGDSVTDKNTPFTFATPSNCTYLRFSTLSVSVDGLDINTIMLNEGSESKPWQPYTEHSVILSQPFDTLYGNESTRDLLTNKQVKRRYAVVAVNNDTDLRGHVYATDDRIVFYFKYYSSGAGASTKGLCTHLQSVTDASLLQNQDCVYFESSGAIIASLTRELTPTLDDARAWLIDNNVKFLQPLEDALTEDLPLADQIALSGIPTYDGTTYVEWDCDIQPTLIGEYGTSKVGGYTLEARQTAIVNGIKQEMANERISALEATLVYNI